MTGTCPVLDLFQSTTHRQDQSRSATACLRVKGQHHLHSLPLGSAHCFLYGELKSMHELEVQLFVVTVVLYVALGLDYHRVTRKVGR